MGLRLATGDRFSDLEAWIVERNARGTPPSPARSVACAQSSVSGGLGQAVKIMRDNAAATASERYDRDVGIQKSGEMLQID